MPFALLPLCSWLLQDYYNYTVVYAFSIILLGAIERNVCGFKNGLAVLCALFSYYSPFFLAIAIFPLYWLRARYTIIWITIFLCISILPLPIISFSIWFWGIPFLVAVSSLVYFISRRLLLKQLVFTCFLALSITTSAYSVFTYSNNDTHYGMTDEFITDNFIKNAISSGKYTFSNENNNYGIRSSFVFGNGSVLRRNK